MASLLLSTALHDERMLSKSQQQRIAQYLEQDLDMHAQRIDETSITSEKRVADFIHVSYTLLESGGCSGPGRVIDQTASVPVTLLAD